MSHMKKVHEDAWSCPAVQLGGPLRMNECDAIPPNECSSCHLGFVSSIDASDHFRVAHKNIYNSSNLKFVLRVLLRKCDG